ncbi:MAG: DUF2971 domain-containing protein [Chrysiogenia bacterium]
MIIYKYLPPSRIDVLEDSRIRFTQPAALNDPFETFPCFLEFGPWLLDKVHQQSIDKFGMKDAKNTLLQRQTLVVQTLLDIPKILSKHFVILSLSKIRDNSLMWSHYSDSHRGFVIGFDSSSAFFSPGTGKAKDGLKMVRYSNDRYLVPKNGFHSLDDLNLRKANAKLFFTKGSYWRYEREMRILAHPDSADVVLPDPKGYDIRLFNFPEESVKEVIIGFRMTEPDPRRVFNLVRSKFSHATIGKALPHESRFALIVKMFAD